MAQLVSAKGSDVLAWRAAGDFAATFRQVILVGIDTTQIPTPEVGGYWWVQTGTGLTKFPIIAVKPQAAERLLVALEDPVFLNNYLPQRRSRIYLVYRRASGVTATAPRRAGP